MTPTVTFWTRRGAVEPHWQLGDPPPDSTRWALLGWNVTPEPVDGGMPPAAGAVLARAFGACARVSFLQSTRSPQGDSATWTSNGDDWVRGSQRTAWAARIAERARHGPGHVSLCCSRRVEAIEAAFADPDFPWWLQSQVLLLSAPDAALPDVTPEDALGLLATNWSSRAAGFRQAGVVAVARPGVDGDAVGLLGLEDGWVDRVCAALTQ